MDKYKLVNYAFIGAGFISGYIMPKVVDYIQKVTRPEIQTEPFSLEDKINMALEDR